MIKKLNVFFFDDEQPHEDDTSAYYGMYIAVTVICLMLGIQIF